MKVEFINPFIESLTNVIVTMATVESKRGKATLKMDDVAQGDVTGIIGMIGEAAKGSLAVTFTEVVILDITSKMLRDSFTEVNAEVLDCVGEIVNMVTGGAKKLLAEQGYEFDMATPTIVSGKNHTITHKFDGTKIIIPFSTEAGAFFVELCFEDKKKSNTPLEKSASKLATS